jgi:hypothetical protein
MAVQLSPHLERAWALAGVRAPVYTAAGSRGLISLFRVNAG